MSHNIFSKQTHIKIYRYFVTAVANFEFST